MPLQLTAARLQALQVAGVDVGPYVALRDKIQQRCFSKAVAPSKQKELLAMKAVLLDKLGLVGAEADRNLQSAEDKIAEGLADLRRGRAGAQAHMAASHALVDEASLMKSGGLCMYICSICVCTLGFRPPTPPRRPTKRVYVRAAGAKRVYIGAGGR